MTSKPFILLRDIQPAALVTLGVAGLLSFLSGCSGSHGPAQVATAYLRADLIGKRAEAYTYLSADDRAVKSLSEYSGEGAALGEAIGKMIEANVSVSVDSVAEHGDRATVIARVTHPDVMAMMGDVMSAALASALAGDTAKAQQEMADAIRRKYVGKSLPTTTTSDTVDLIREAEGWRVIRNWRADALQERADSLNNEGKLREALALYDSVVALVPQRHAANERRQEVSRAIAVEEMKQAYIRGSLALEQFRVATGRRFGGFGEPEPAVFGTIRNKGDSTLTRVEITVFFLGADDKPIAETTFNPVFVSEFSLSDKGPLKAGYVRDFGYSVQEYAPSGWGRKARAEITRIEFQSEHAKN